MQKKQSEIFFIGCFPPPTGGATVKNEIFYAALSRRAEIQKFNTSGLVKNPLNILRFCLFIHQHRHHAGFLSVASQSLLRFTRYISFYSENLLSRISVMVVGGRLDVFIKGKGKWAEMLSQYKNIYVETVVLEKKLKQLGLKNVFVLPNCRPRFKNPPLLASKKEKAFHCIFLSKICIEKGVREIFQAAHALNQRGMTYQIDFYGPVEASFEEEFRRELSRNPRLSYLGVLSAQPQKLYEILSRYDVLLFPTKHTGEGMPGILIEAKMAGLPVIASDWNYNSEIVRHMEDGILLSGNSSENLRDALILLHKDKGLLARLAKNSLRLGTHYDIERVLPMLWQRL